MRGYERALTDPLLKPALTDAYLGRMSDFFVAWNECWLDAAGGEFDLFRCGDELGTMDRLFTRPEVWRRVYKPHLAKVWAVATQRGIKPWWHCCGYCRPLLEDMIEIGMELWDSVPPNVKDNDATELKRAYGDLITFVGGVDHLLMVNGTPKQVADEVRLRLDQLAPGGGLILGPGQAFTPDMPLENILAFYETAHRYGVY
jgi:uroporphyrinogen decarboxylase